MGYIDESVTEQVHARPNKPESLADPLIWMGPREETDRTPLGGLFSILQKRMMMFIEKSLQGMWSAQRSTRMGKEARNLQEISTSKDRLIEAAWARGTPSGPLRPF